MAHTFTPSSHYVGSRNTYYTDLAEFALSLFFTYSLFLHTYVHRSGTNTHTFKHIPSSPSSCIGGWKTYQPKSFFTCRYSLHSQHAHSLTTAIPLSCGRLMAALHSLTWFLYVCVSFPARVYSFLNTQQCWSTHLYSQPKLHHSVSGQSTDLPGSSVRLSPVRGSRSRNRTTLQARLRR